MFKRSMQLLLVAFVVACGLRAADDPFVGQWKLAPSRSKLTDKMKVTKVGENKYAFDLGGDGSVETIVVDGTDQPGLDGTTLSVAAVGPDAWKVVRKKDGRTTIIGNWKLSKDGHTLADNFNAISADGSTSTLDYVYQKKGGGSGFAGTWVSTSETVTSGLTMQIKPYENGGLSFTDPGGTTNMKFDGKDANAGAGSSNVQRVRLNTSTLKITQKSYGKIKLT